MKNNNSDTNLLAFFNVKIIIVLQNLQTLNWMVLICEISKEFSSNFFQLFLPKSHWKFSSLHQMIFLLLLLFLLESDGIFQLENLVQLPRWSSSMKSNNFRVWHLLFVVNLRQIVEQQIVHKFGDFFLLSDLVTDGFPLCHFLLDSLVVLGLRFDSASFKYTLNHKLSNAP